MVQPRKIVYATVHNPDLPFPVLLRMYPDVRCVARNHTTPVHILEHLAFSWDWLVQARVAINPSTPTYVLRRIVADPMNTEVLLWTAYNPNAPADVLEQLSYCGDGVAKAVTFHKNTPLEALLRLQQHSAQEVQQCASYALQRRS